MTYHEEFVTSRIVSQPSRTTTEVILVAFGLAFVMAAWKLLSATGEPQDISMTDARAQEIVGLARPDRVCPDIVDRNGKPLVTTQTVVSGDARTHQERTYFRADALGTVLGGTEVADGVVRQQMLAGLPDKTPGWPFLSWQGWTMGPPPAITTTLDSELCVGLHDLLVRQQVYGCIIVGTPDGEILACVQNPCADITHMRENTYVAQLAAASKDSRVPALTNPWQWRVPPGSTIKPFLDGVARQNGVAPPDVECRGVTTEFGRPLHCHRVHGKIDTFAAALAGSCNMFFFELSCEPRMGGELLVSYATACGLASPQLAGAQCATAELPWASAAPGTEARALSFIGQGISVSPLGLMSAYAAILFDGPPQWHLIGKLDGRPVAYPAPKAVFDSSVVRAVRADMKAIAAYGTTTTSMASVRRYQPLIKTGTAEVGGSQGPDSWAVGSFSVGNASYVMCCLVRNWTKEHPRAQAIAAQVISTVAKQTDPRARSG